MNKTQKIFVGGALVVGIAILAYFLIIKPSMSENKDKKQGGEEEEEEEDPYIEVPDPSDIPDDPDVPDPNNDDPPDEPHERREVDPNSTEGKNLLKYQMEEYFNNSSAMYQIKKQNEIGRGIFNGISPNKKLIHGSDRSPENSIEGFLNSIAGGSFVRSDFGTYPIFSDLEKNGLYAEMDVLASENWAVANQLQAGRKDFQGYTLHQLGGENITNHFGGLFRKHDVRLLRQAKTAAGNYRSEMVRLDAAVRNAAIRALSTQKNIWFIGINAASQS